MKILHLLFVVAFSAASSAHAAENRYDILGKTLAPFINVLAKSTKNPNRAMALGAKLERLTGASSELIDTHVDLLLQYPDRLFIHGPILGEDLTVCRDRQQVWVTPGAKVKLLLDLATAQKKLAKPDPAAQLEPFQLPVPEKQLVFLPVLFKVADAGSESVDGEVCRVLDVTLMPDLQKSLMGKTWAARIWVRADYKPARLILTKTDWELAVKFDKVEFAPKLPDTTWQPPTEDVLTLDAPRFRQLMQAVVK